MCMYVHAYTYLHFLKMVGTLYVYLENYVFQKFTILCATTISYTMFV